MEDYRDFTVRHDRVLRLRSSQLLAIKAPSNNGGRGKKKKRKTTNELFNARIVSMHQYALHAVEDTEAESYVCNKSHFQKLLIIKAKSTECSNT